MVSQLDSAVVHPAPTGQSPQNQKLHDPFLPRLEGFVQVVTATHRGFLTNVVSQALRVAGQGNPVLMVQLLKGGSNQGISNPTRLCQYFTWIRCNVPYCIDAENLNEQAIAVVQELWQHTRLVTNRGQYDLVILDEISLALSLKIIALDDVLGFLQERPKHVDVILTGPQMPDRLMGVADQVTELRRFYRA
jgi:cob(I)alamin adenosyltransferase